MEGRQESRRKARREAQSLAKVQEYQSRAESPAKGQEGGKMRQGRAPPRRSRQSRAGRQQKAAAPLKLCPHLPREQSRAQQAAPNGARPPSLLPALSDFLRSYRPP